MGSEYLCIKCGATMGPIRPPSGKCARCRKEDNKRNTVEVKMDRVDWVAWNEARIEVATLSKALDAMKGTCYKEEKVRTLLDDALKRHGELCARIEEKFGE